jgi:tetratricopeptide (TPR) repeat protein
VTGDSSNSSFSEARYKAFISYSHHDEKWSKWLHRALESYKPPKHLVGQETEQGPIPARLAPVFRDREELHTATDLGEVITEALQESACQIVLCSPAAAQSKWVNEEILAYKRMGGERRIFSIIIAGEPNASALPGGQDMECFPHGLRYKLGADGELSDERAEPIAADARENKDGRRNAKLKLIAGILGVGYDMLAQREQQRRHQRMMSIAAASFAGMLVTSGLAITAMLARAEAVEQRARAEIEAETAQQTTNFLVELFEVSDPSEALGNTITAREILDRGARRIEFDLTNQPAIQSNLMDTMGTVYRSLGLYTQARSLLEQGLSTRQTLYGSDHPVVARSQSNIAELLGMQAEFDEAVQHYQQSIQILKALPEEDGAALALSIFGLADVYSLQGDFNAAEIQFRQAVAIQSAQSDGRSLDLARSLDQLGMNVSFLARPEEAEQLLREALAMRMQLLPGGVHPDIEESLNNLGVFLYEQGRYEETERLFRESLQMKLQLMGEDHQDVAFAMNNLAMVLQDSGDYGEAEEYLLQSLSIRQARLGNDHPQVAASLNNLAFLFHDQGKAEQAVDFSRQALDTYRAAYSGDHPDIAYGLQNLASWLVEQGDYLTAEDMLEEALAINQRVLPQDHPDVAITRSGMAVLLLETDRPEAALEMATTANDSLIQSYGEEHWRTNWAQSLRGAALSTLKRFDEAEPLLVNSYESLKNNSGARPVLVRTELEIVATLYTAWGRPEDAEPYIALLNASKTD